MVNYNSFMLFRLFDVKREKGEDTTKTNTNDRAFNLINIFVPLP